MNDYDLGSTKVENNYELRITNYELRMTVSDLKLRIFREIDSLDKKELEEIYGMLLNYIHTRSELSEWDKLIEIHRKGILDAVKQVEEGKGISHGEFNERFRKKLKLQ